MGSVLDEAAAGAPFRERVVGIMRRTQDSVCAAAVALERELGSGADFADDEWRHGGGGGGRTRVLCGGAFLEKGGVNVSAVTGVFPGELAARLPGSGTAFFATGVSLVFHPQSPHVPAVHANFRYVEHGDRRWFGGGADLTPCYLHAEDRDHFHGVWRRLCERHRRVADYERFRDQCDRYFHLPHRGERRGVGGIFFDDLFVDDADPEHLEAATGFVSDGGAALLDAYLPIARRRVRAPYTPDQKRWQQIRRGRYVEFNLLYDRGTAFGLKTGGRTESILMSLPPQVRWGYAEEPEPGTAERALLDELQRPPPPEETP
ncbi:MAG: oxygen-dependent coproporphyrinogen oxidase [Planctomycetota bacterium]